MTTMEWKEVNPEQSDWKKQIDVMAYYGSQKIGSIVCCNSKRDWRCVIEGKIDFLMAETEDEAKKEMIEILDEHFEDKINYYEELRESLTDLDN